MGESLRGTIEPKSVISVTFMLRPRWTGAEKKGRDDPAILLMVMKVLSPSHHKRPAGLGVGGPIMPGRVASGVLVALW